MQAEMIVLRLVHIVTGIFWVGTVMFVGLFLAPTLAGLGPTAGQVMAGLRNRKFLTVMPIVSVLTMLTGFRMMWIASVGSMGAYMQSNVGRTFSLGGAAAVLAFFFGIIVARPAAMRAGVLAGELQTAVDDAMRARLNAELETVRRRGNLAGTITTVLLVLATAAMATARYLG